MMHACHVRFIRSPVQCAATSVTRELHQRSECVTSVALNRLYKQEADTIKRTPPSSPGTMDDSWRAALRA